MSHLSKEEIMGLRAVAKKNKDKMSNCEIAKLFEVTEGTVRYYLLSDPRHTERLLVIEQSHYEGKSTKDVVSPEKLSRVTRTLLECFGIPVEKKAVKVYEKLVEAVG